MKNKAILFVLLLMGSYCFPQNNFTVSSGESPIHKKSDNAKALNEAIMDAQTNAVIAFGGNINVLNVSKKENITESKKGAKDKKYENSGSYSSDDKFFLLLMYSDIGLYIRPKQSFSSTSIFIFFSELVR